MGRFPISEWPDVLIVSRRAEPSGSPVPTCSDDNRQANEIIYRIEAAVYPEEYQWRFEYETRL